MTGDSPRREERIEAAGPLPAMLAGGRKGRRVTAIRLRRRGLARENGLLVALSCFG